MPRAPAARSPSLGPNALTHLTAGFARLQQLLRRHLRLQREGRGAAASAARGEVVQQLCGELAVQLTLEDSVLFPALRESLHDTRRVDEAEVEHECLRELIDRLRNATPDEPLFDARVAVLGRLLTQSQQRNVRQLYPAARSSGVDLVALGHALRERSLQLQQELQAGQGPRFEDEAADPVGAPPR